MSTNEIRDELCRVGKIVSVDVKIINTSEALNLADTMFNGESLCGVEVQSWGVI